METYHHIDWLSATFPKDFDFRRFEKWAGEFKEAGRGVTGYKASYKSDYGAFALTDGTDEQGVHIILSADVLAVARTPELTDKRLAEFVRFHGGKASRVDVACDIWNGGISVDDLIAAYQRKEILTPAKSARQNRKIDAPDNTFYLGSPQSDRMFRAYNKAAEVGIELLDWLRLELQTRKDRSKALLTALAEHENTTAVVSRAIADYCDWPDPRYQSALSDQNATIELLPRNAPNFTNGSTDRLLRLSQRVKQITLMKIRLMTYAPPWMQSKLIEPNARENRQQEQKNRSGS